MTQLSLTYSLFFQPKTLPPQPSSQRGGSHYGSQFLISDLSVKASKRLHHLSVVLSREVILPMRSLRFNCSEGEGDSLYDIHSINLFINATLERRIENLELDMVYWPKDYIKKKKIKW